MIYCMSDLHGERALFERMLERIRFSDGDRLYIIGDVIDRRPDGVDLLERIIAYMTANIGTPFSATSISRFLKSEGRKVSVETILNYIRYCLDAYLFYRVKRRDLQGKQLLTTNEKYYIADHGIREAARMLVVLIA